MVYSDYNKPLLNKAHSVATREQFIASHKMHHDFADYNYQLAKLYFHEGDCRNAMLPIEKALQKNADYLLAHMLRTKIKIEGGDFIHAYHDFAPLRQRYDTYADVLYLNAVLLYFNNNTIEALGELRRASELNPLYHDAYLLELIIYRDVGRVQEMYRLRKQLCEHEINNVPEHYFYSGLLLYERHHWASGVILFESAFVLGYDPMICSYNTACLYVLLNKFRTAQEIFKKIIAQKPEYRSYMQEDSDLLEFRKTDFYAALVA